MLIEKSKVESLQKIGQNTFLLKVFSPSIAKTILPGQFCNIKVSQNNSPLLRRPFSICDVEGEHIFFLFDVHGEGTQILANKRKGDFLDILGPLGNGFNVDGEYETAIIIAGGIGTAPFPFLIKKLFNKNLLTLVGARSSNMVITERLKNVLVATDDGSMGMKGTVIDLLKEVLQENKFGSFRIFACGPNGMLKALQKISLERNYDCQLSIESAMACGFGICQGCPVESKEGESYKLICKDGPVFSAVEIML